MQGSCGQTCRMRALRRTRPPAAHDHNLCMITRCIQRHGACLCCLRAHSCFVLNPPMKLPTHSCSTASKQPTALCSFSARLQVQVLALLLHCGHEHASCQRLHPPRRTIYAGFVHSTLTGIQLLLLQDSDAEVTQHGPDCVVLTCTWYCWERDVNVYAQIVPPRQINCCLQVSTTRAVCQLHANHFSCCAGLDSWSS